MLGYNAGMKGQKASTDEGGVRVPFFVRWDGRIAPNRVVDRIAAHLDILPTLAAFAGADIPAEQVEGRSLLRLIEKPDANWTDRYLFTHKGRWKTGADPNDSQWKGFAVRNQQYRFVENNALYDMQKDPGQKTNIIEQHPDVVKKMQSVYDAWWKKTVPMMNNESAPMSPTRPFHVLFQKQSKSTGIPAWKPPRL
jgi:arylsulfatase A-like enzyme